jgi:outer membrane protein
MGARRLLAVLALAALAQAGFSQQITRIAVVDVSKVISAYSKDSQGVKEFELRKSQIQTDIDKMQADIMKLMAQRADANKVGDKAQSLKLGDDIDKKRKTLVDFVADRQAELDDMARKLAATDAFSQDLYKKIQSYAETNGFSIVLNLKSSDAVMNAVIWYSPMIDITADIIQELGGKSP